MKPKLALILFLVALCAIFILQNTEIVPLRFLIFEINLSRVLLLTSALLIGGVVGAVATSLFHRSRARSPDYRR